MISIQYRRDLEKGGSAIGVGAGQPKILPFKASTSPCIEIYHPSNGSIVEKTN